MSNEKRYSESDTVTGDKYENPNLDVKKDTMSSASKTRSMGENRLIAAIDFGTTYSGYAFAFERDFRRDPLQSINTNDWRSSTGVSIVTKAPTTALFTPEDEFHSFGYEAENKYAELVEDDKVDYKEWHCFKRFKMKLYNQMKLRRQFDIVDESGHTMPAKKIFAASIKFLRDDLKRVLAERNPGFGEPDLWVLTVPAIWNEPAKQFMREAAIEAGLENQVILALEPESAVVYCKTLPDGSLFGTIDQELIECFRPGGMYMVLDLGGGTVDTAVHGVRDDGGIKEIHQACGGAWGGTKVDEKFMDHIQHLFGDHVIPILQTECPSEWLKMIKQFEEMKKQVAYEKPRDVKLEIPRKLLIVSTANVEDDLTKYRTNLKINNESFKSFFQPPVEHIHEHVKKILDKFPNLKVVFMVGGFSESDYVQEFLRNKFAEKRIIVPLNAGMAVLKGAVIIGFNELMKEEQNAEVFQTQEHHVTERISQWTYGVRVVVPFIEGNHLPEYAHFTDGSKYCQNIFKVLIKEGDSVSMFEERNCEMGSSHQQEHRRYIDLKVPVYASKTTIPMYTTDENCKAIGEITIKSPEEGWPDHTHFKINMYFGQTEFSVEVRDLNNTDREPYLSSYDFLS